MPTVQCPSCSHAIRVSDNVPGNAITCPECGDLVTIRPPTKKASPAPKASKPANQEYQSFGCVLPFGVAIAALGALASFFIIGTHNNWDSASQQQLAFQAATTIFFTGLLMSLAAYIRKGMR